MLKREMAIAQLTDRQLFVNILKSANWTINKDWEELFEMGVNCSPEALASYQNYYFCLKLSYYIESNYLLLNCVKLKDNSVFSELRFYPKNVEILLGYIIELQDNLSLETFTNFVKKIIPLCDLVVYELPDRLLKISLNEANQHLLQTEI